MSRRERREDAEKRIKDIISYIPESHIAKILQSNLSTIPLHNVLMIERLLHVTHKVGDSLEESLEFCRVNGFLDGPAGVRVINDTRMSVTLLRGHYLCIDVDMGNAYIADDVNGLLPIEGVQETIPYKSRTGLVNSLYSTVYLLLNKLNIQSCYSLCAYWRRNRIDSELIARMKKYCQSVISIYCFIPLDCEDLTGGEVIATLYSDLPSHNHDRCVNTLYCIYKDKKTILYCENPDTHEKAMSACYKISEPTREELARLVYEFAFDHCITRVELKF